MIAYYVGETAGKIHQKQTKGTDTGFSVMQSKAFTSWFETHFLSVLNVYSKSRKAGLSETLKCMFGSDKELTHTYISEAPDLVLDYLGFSHVEPVGDITLVEG